MNVTIVAVDKLRERYLDIGCGMYLKRLLPLLPVRVAEIKAADPQVEARAILRSVGRDAQLWALAADGVQLSSTDLAAKLHSAAQSGRNALVLVIGGAQGLHASVLERADFRWSLSSLTLLHEMARLVVLEQLYRAMKIARNEPYHR